MSVNNRYLSFVPERVTNDEIEDIFDEKKCGNNSYGRFKKELDDKFNAVKIAGVCNDVIRSEKLVDDHYEIKFETKNLKYDLSAKKDISIDPDVFIMLMEDIFKIELENKNGYIEGSIPLNAASRYLTPKIPKIEESKEDPLRAHLLSSYLNKEGMDAIFKVKNGEIRGHSLILTHVPCFKKILSIGPETFQYLDFKEFDLKVMDAYFKYLYSGKLTEDGGFLLLSQMMDLANVMSTWGFEDKNLKLALLNKIHEMIKGETFVDFVIIEHKDADLKDLSTWVFYEYAKKKKDAVDFTQCSFSSLCKLYPMKDGIQGVKWSGIFMEELVKKLELTDAFIGFCNNIVKQKDKNAKVILVDALKKNEKLYGQLTQDDTYKDHKKAFNAIMKDINLI